ncbi:putative lipid II flippase FtsW [Patescibacteria group bacterium]|nr:putative lipid II flippase FtsW [Patescibacteria group bacterium]
MRDGGRNWPDLPFAALAGALVLFGLIMLTSASWPLGFDRFHDGAYFVKHQILFGLLPGLVGFTAAYMIPYQQYRKWALPLFAFSVLLLLLVFVPGVGAEFGTSRSWISIAGISAQPSEIVKLTFLIYLAAWSESRAGNAMRDREASLIPFVLSLGAIVALLLAQPDTGSMLIIACMAMAVYFVAGAPVGRFIGFSAIAALGGLLLYKISPYRAARFTTFLHPELDPQGIGYHINQALLAIGSGGVFGRGYGHSLQKFQYLPEVAGDSIFAVIAEELGFFLTAGFIALYVAFLFAGIRIAERAPDLFGRFLVTGVVAWFGVQAFMNIGAMVGVAPITGVPLPFVSYGGTALAVSLTAVGLVLNVSRTSKAD